MMINILGVPFLLGMSVSFLMTKAPTAEATYLDNAVAASSTLINNYYNETNGLFSNNWWQSANAITTLADLVAIDPNSSTSASIISDIANTFRTAPNTHPGFLDDFYDDEGWWALAWIQAYDATNKTEYLDKAKS